MSNKIHELVKQIAPTLADENLALVFSDNPSDWAVDYDWDKDEKELVFFKLAPKFLFKNMECNQFEFLSSEEEVALNTYTSPDGSTYQELGRPQQKSESYAFLNLYIEDPEGLAGYRITTYDFFRNERNIQNKLAAYSYAAQCVLLNQPAQDFDPSGSSYFVEGEENSIEAYTYTEWERNYFEPETDIFNKCRSEKAVEKILTKLGLLT